MNNAEGSSVSHVRSSDAAAFVVASLVASALLLPIPSEALILSQSTTTHQDEIQIYTPNAAQSWFAGTRSLDDINLGSWSGPDFTTDSDTTVHLWLRWNGLVGSQLDFLLDTSSGGDPYFGAPTSTSRIAGPPGGYYDIDTPATSTLQEYSLPANAGETIHHGDELWALMVPSWSAYGADHWIGGSGTMPQVEVCEGSCMPPAPAAPAESNILFIPGIELSRLYTSSGGTEHELWEPGILSDQGDVKSLYLDSSGNSINPVYTKANGAIDTENGRVVGGVTFSGDDIYRTFFSQLAGLKASSTIADYLIFPYDWRVSPDDVVNKGVAYDDGTHYLDQELIALAATSKTGKVTVVGHSNGGLVAKELIIKLQAEGMSDLVDKVILVDVPQIGTPEAVAALLHGDFQKIPDSNGFIVSQANARGLAENMPEAYDLLPSSTYFTRVATPVVDLTAAPNLNSIAGIATSTITNLSDLADLITGAGGRQKPAYQDVETPEVLSPVLLTKAETLHASIDAWQPPAGVQVIQIAGWGLDTPSGVTYSEKPVAECQNNNCTIVPAIRHVVNMTEDGDGTVVSPSEAAISNLPTYFINLNKFNDDKHAKFNHGDITETLPFQSLFNLLISSSSPQVLPSYVTVTQPFLSTTGKSLRLRVLSPVSLDAYDSLGNHTGMAPNPNPQSDDLYVEEQIPGSYYQQYGEGQYIGLPAGGNYHVVLHGLDTGTFTFEITPVSGGVAGAPITFADVPVTASSTASINLIGSSPASTTLALDMNGDGVVDTTIASSSQAVDPLGYAQLAKSSIGLMDIGVPVQKQLQAKFTNTIYLLTKVDKWDMDDSDATDTAKADKVGVRVLRKLGKIETYLQSEIGKPVSKRDKDERITESQAAAIIDMIEQLKVLVNSKQL